MKMKSPPVEGVLQMVKNSRIPGSGTHLTWVSFLLLPHTALEQPTYFLKLWFPPQQDGSDDFSGTED